MLFSVFGTDLEITGYAKVLSAAEGNNLDLNDFEARHLYELSWRGRGTRHNNEVPCEGTALNGGIKIDGENSWKKEIWHKGG